MLVSSAGWTGQRGYVQGKELGNRKGKEELQRVLEQESVLPWSERKGPFLLLL